MAPKQTRFSPRFHQNGLKQRGIVFIFSCYNIWSPTYLHRSSFFCFFFFPRVKKKNRAHFFVFFHFLPSFVQKLSRNLVFRWLFGINLGLCFFFTLNPEGKKKTRKYPPTYLFLRRPSLLYVITRKRKNYTPLLENSPQN